MACDEAGNLYVAHVGSGFVYVYDRDGRQVEEIPSGGRKPTNVCFGGPAYDQLFVTVDDDASIERFDLGVVGHRLSFCPSLRADHPWARMLPPPPDPAGAG